MKKINVDEQINELFELNKSVDYLKKEREEEIIISENNINAKYAVLINENYQLMREISNNVLMMYKNYEKKSVFDIMTIGKVIADLISFCEGDEYLLHTARFVIKDRERSIAERLVQNVECNVMAITKKSDVHSTYYDLANENSMDNIFILQKSTQMDFDRIKFYSYHANIDNLANVKPNKDITCPLFPYVDSFIESVVDYRINNDIEEITEEQLYDVMKKYIVANHEQIKGYKNQVMAKNHIKVMQNN